MCSNMCARPVIPGTSRAEPTFTTVAYEKTGASGRSMMMSVRPLSSLFSVVRFSNEARSCAKSDDAASSRPIASANVLRRVCRMGLPPGLCCRTAAGYASIYDEFLSRLPKDGTRSALRDFGTEERFDLVTGSPPYFPEGTATGANHPQAIPARIEVRGNVADYARTAARILAPGGLFAFVFPAADARVNDALRDAGLTLIRRRDVVFKEGEPPLIALFAAARTDDMPVTVRKRGGFIEPPLIIRDRD